MMQQERGKVMDTMFREYEQRGVRKSKILVSCDHATTFFAKQGVCVRAPGHSEAKIRFFKWFFKPRSLKTPSGCTEEHPFVPLQ